MQLCKDGCEAITTLTRYAAQCSLTQSANLVHKLIDATLFTPQNVTANAAPCCTCSPKVLRTYSHDRNHFAPILPSPISITLARRRPQVTF